MLERMLARLGPIRASARAKTEQLIMVQPQKNRYRRHRHHPQRTVQRVRTHRKLPQLTAQLGDLALCLELHSSDGQLAYSADGC
jgi:hypothetical protein